MAGYKTKKEIEEELRRIKEAERERFLNDVKKRSEVIPTHTGFEIMSNDSFFCDEGEMFAAVPEEPSLAKQHTTHNFKPMHNDPNYGLVIYGAIK